jgi:hypothetical protein
LLLLRKYFIAYRKKLRLKSFETVPTIPEILHKVLVKMCCSRKPMVLVIGLSSSLFRVVDSTLFARDPAFVKVPDRDRLQYCLIPEGGLMNVNVCGVP